MPFQFLFRADTIPAPSLQHISQVVDCEASARGITSFMSSYAGVSFENGLYRVHALENVEKWSHLVCEAYPDFKGRILTFAYDWNGNQFALDFGRMRGDQALILLFELGMGGALEIPTTFSEFHEMELINNPEAVLVSGVYTEWLTAGGAAPNLSECVGYQKPPFLGGEDSLSNLELIDIEVYWSLFGQVLAKTRYLPEGSVIGNVTLE